MMLRITVPHPNVAFESTVRHSAHLHAIVGMWVRRVSVRLLKESGDRVASGEDTTTLSTRLCVTRNNFEMISASLCFYRHV